MMSLEKIGLIVLSHGWEHEDTRCTHSQQGNGDDGEVEWSGGCAGVLVGISTVEVMLVWIWNCYMEREV